MSPPDLHHSDVKTGYAAEFPMSPPDLRHSDVNILGGSVLRSTDIIF
jgi:hypothetical protein